VAKAGQIVISGTTRETLRSEFVTRSLGDYQPKGMSRKVPCYELLGRKV
jgi:class 3 adenylate cyclase